MRRNCQRPDACVAAQRGRCPVCQPQTDAEREAGRERMRRQNADPMFVIRREAALVRMNEARRKWAVARRPEARA